MSTLFDTRDRAAILERITRLTEDRRPSWGRFTAPEMVCHVSTGLRNGLDEVDLGPSVRPLNRWPINWLVIHVVPWPKGAKTPPEMLATKSTTWSADVAALRDLIQRFGARDPRGAWPRPTASSTRPRAP